MGEAGDLSPLIDFIFGKSGGHQGCIFNYLIMQERILFLVLIITALGQLALACQIPISNTNLQTGLFQILKQSNALPNASSNSDAQWVNLPLKSSFDRIPNVAVSLPDMVSFRIKQHLYLVVNTLPSNQTSILNFVVVHPRALSDWFKITVGYLAEAIPNAQAISRIFTITGAVSLNFSTTQTLVFPINASLNQTPGFISTFLSGFHIQLNPAIEDARFSVFIKNSSISQNGINITVEIGRGNQLKQLFVSYALFENIETRQGGIALSNKVGLTPVQINQGGFGSYNYSLFGVSGFNLKGTEPPPTIIVNFTQPWTLNVYLAQHQGQVSAIYLFIKVPTCFGCPGKPYLFQNTCQANCPPNSILRNSTCTSCPANSQVAATRSFCVCNPRYFNISGVCKTCENRQYWNGERCVPIVLAMARVQQGNYAMIEVTQKYDPSVQRFNTDSQVKNFIQNQNDIPVRPPQVLFQPTTQQFRVQSNTTPSLQQQNLARAPFELQSPPLSTPAQSPIQTLAPPLPPPPLIPIPPMPTCPSGLFFQTSQSLCKPCPKPCQTCNSLSCTTCPPGFTLAPPNCTQVCGDGKRFILQCDDGNTVDGDGCSSSCIIQPLWNCNGGGQTSTDVCFYTKPDKVTIEEVEKYVKDKNVIIKVKLNWLPASFVADGCQACSKVLNVTILDSPYNPYVGITYDPGSTYSFNLQYSTLPSNYLVRVKINPALQTPFFTGIDISTPLDLRIESSNLQRRT